MTYSVKEIYLTLQGEGAQTGRAAVFARFAGCNLWSGREEDRSTAPCWFCDTDFVGTNGPGGGKFAGAASLAGAIRACWDQGTSQGSGTPYVVFTGGEPTLQLDEDLVSACHVEGIEVAIETNGTREVAAGVDWICVSPKPGSLVVQRRGQEMKLVFPQEVAPGSVEGWEFQHFFLQPRDGVDRESNTRAAIEHCLRHPKWRLSLQTHKLLGIP